MHAEELVRLRRVQSSPRASVRRRGSAVSGPARQTVTTIRISMADVALENLLVVPAPSRPSLGGRFKIGGDGQSGVDDGTCHLHRCS